MGSQKTLVNLLVFLFKAPSCAPSPDASDSCCAVVVELAGPLACFTSFASALTGTNRAHASNMDGTAFLSGYVSLRSVRYVPSQYT